LSLALIRIDGNLKPSLAAEFEVAKEDALASSALIGIVDSDAVEQEAVNAAVKISTLLKHVEASRKAVKEPFLDACQRIDQAAKDAVAELKAEEIRIRTSIGNFQQEKLAEARRKEAERQAELDRIEADRQAELRRIAEAEAKARSAKARAELEEQRLLATARANQAVDAVGAPVATTKAIGQVVTPTWDFEVTDIWLLARAHPAFVKIEPVRSEILLAIKTGMKDIKGLRVFEVVKSTVRTPKQKIIDV